MKFKNRIFLKTNNEIREFLWLQQGADGSIYIGCACRFSFGRQGNASISKDDVNGTQVNPDSGKSLAQEELGGKLSFHKSGVVNLPVISVDKRDRLRIKAFSEYEGALPLFSVIPMIPTKYPLSNKNVKHDDLVIDCGINQGKCIGVVIFVAFNEPNPNLFLKLREEGLFITVISTNMYDRKLCAMLYFNEQFYGWPKGQVDITPHPDDSGEMPWTVIVPTYDT